LDRKTPSTPRASTSAKLTVAGNTWVRMPRLASIRGVFALMPRSIAATEKILRAKETADDQTNLVNAFISNLERTPATTAPKGRV
jgi:hypothetical protein